MLIKYSLKLNLLVGIVIILSLFMFHIQANGVNEHTSTSTLDEPIVNIHDIDYGSELRKRVGFDSDKIKVKNLLSKKLKEPKNVEYVNGYGTVWEKAELDELDKRLTRLNEIVPKIEEDVKNRFEKTEYGGIYVKQNQKGTIYIGLKEIPKDNFLLSLKNKYNYQNIKYFKIAHSLEELEILRDTVLNQYSKDLKIISVSIDIENNSLEVGVEEVLENTISILKQLAGKYEIKILKLPPNEITSRDVYKRPLQGGLLIVNERTKMGCTSAFTAYKNTYDGTKYFNLTAGHCGDYLHPFSQGNENFGSMYYQMKGQNVDAGAITIRSGWKTHFIYGEYSNSYEITSVDKQQYRGAIVCYAGAVTNRTKCGEVLDSSTTQLIGSAIITDMVKISGIDNKGDSGAPVYNHGAAMGIISSRNIEGNYTLYSKIGNVLSTLRLDGILVK